jgi:hypothetical protein
MFKEPHHFEFTKDSLGADQALKYIRKFFQCHTFPIPRISDGPYYTKGSVSDRSIWQIFIWGITSRASMLLLLLLMLLKKGRLGRSQDRLARRGSRGPRGSGRHCRRGSMEHAGSSALSVQVESRRGPAPTDSTASTCFFFICSNQITFMTNILKTNVKLILWGTDFDETFFRARILTMTLPEKKYYSILVMFFVVVLCVQGI